MYEDIAIQASERTVLSNELEKEIKLKMVVQA